MRVEELKVAEERVEDAMEGRQEIMETNMGVLTPGSGYSPCPSQVNDSVSPTEQGESCCEALSRL